MKSLYPLAALLLFAIGGCISVHRDDDDSSVTRTSTTTETPTVTRTTTTD